jgi:two-component system osmolarity sensor histidine kinase EnvZ
MSFNWLKQYVPRGLYGRAALILVAPVVVVQLVVSTAFIQQHLEDITTQMTLTLVREFRLIEQITVEADTQQQVLDLAQPFLGPLQLVVQFVTPADVPQSDDMRWYDYSARIVAQTLRTALPGTLSAQFPDNRIIVLFIDTDLGPARITFDRRRVTAAAPHQLIVTMLLFGGVMTVIAFVYLRNQLRPILRLARAAQAFGRGQNTPFTPGGAVELRAAGNAFLDMRARIERHIEQRTLMLSGVSHDLRTPLTRLRLGLSLLDEKDAEPLLRDVDEMQHMLDAFLDFSRGAAEGQPEKVDPRALVSAIVEDAQRSGSPVELARQDGQGTVMLRPWAIRRAVENLIGNAVQYGNRALVSVVITDKALRIRVEDDGPGIPEAQRTEAIRPFTRLDPARNQNKRSGVGLGLAIANDIARAHGGVLRLGASDQLGGLQADIVIGR